MDIELDLNMKDQGDLPVNGKDCNGKSQDIDLLSPSLKDKLKGSMDGFGIVSRNGDNDMTENGVRSNGTNGDESANGDEDIVSLVEDESNDGSKMSSANSDSKVDEDSKDAQSVDNSVDILDDESKDAQSLNEDSKDALDNDSREAQSMDNDSGDAQSMDNDSRDVKSVDDESKDAHSIDEDSKSALDDDSRDAQPINDDSKPALDEDSNAISEVTACSSKADESQEESMDVKISHDKEDSNAANVDIDNTAKDSEENSKDGVEIEGGLAEKDGHSKGDLINEESLMDTSTTSDKNNSVNASKDDGMGKKDESVMIEDSPVKTLKTSEKPSKPSKVDRMLASEKSQGSSSSGSENLRPFAKLLFELGLDMTRQQVYKDLIKVQSKKHNHNKLNDKEEQQLDKLKDAFTHLVDKNKTFSLEDKKCPKCNFKSNSVNALEYHKEFDHKGGCSMCSFVTGNASAFYFHMEAEHNRQGRVEPTMGIYVCPHCPYEHHSAKKNYLKHLVKCEKSFDLKRNLQPMPADCDIPLKPVPVSVQQAQNNLRKPPPLVKKPDVPMAQIAPVSRNVAPVNIGAMRPTSVAGQSLIQQGLPPWLNVQEKQGPQLVQMGGQYFLVVNQNGQTFMTPMTTGAVPGAASGATPVPVPVQAPTPAATQPKQTMKATCPDPKQKIAPKKGFEICEICGGFVKDRDSLRIHFFWAHKIEIHPSLMKAKDPALKCNNAQCSRRFWTYQGYQRHVTVNHGGEASKAPTPGMTCYVCGIHTVDFITHMTAKHPQVVKHMLSQMRCVVCQDALPTETALESHMFIEHKDVVTKYGSLVGGSKNNSKKPENPTDAVPVSVPVRNEVYPPMIDCSRCDKKFRPGNSYSAHFAQVHGSEKEPCNVCKEEVQVGKSFIEHMEEHHMKDLSIPVVRLAEETIAKHLASLPASRKRKSSDDVIVIDLDDKRQKLDADLEPANSECSDEQKDKENTEKVDDADADESMDQDNDKKKYIEEIIDVDGEQVVIQKLVE